MDGKVCGCTNEWTNGWTKRRESGCTIGGCFGCFLISFNVSWCLSILIPFSFLFIRWQCFAPFEICSAHFLFTSFDRTNYGLEARADSSSPTLSGTLLWFINITPENWNSYEINGFFLLVIALACSGIEYKMYQQTVKFDAFALHQHYFFYVSSNLQCFCCRNIEWTVKFTEKNTQNYQ